MSTAIVRFDLPTQKNKQLQVNSNQPMLTIDDEEVKKRFNQSEQPDPTTEEIRFAKVVLKVYGNATNFVVKPSGSGAQGNGEGALAGVVLGLILAVIFAPLLIILGMRNKFLLKKLYNNRSGNEYKRFTKIYTYIGIALYAVVAILIALGSVLSISGLTMAGVYTLFLGEIVYFILSLVLTKKYKN